MNRWRKLIVSAVLTALLLGGVFFGWQQGKKIELPLLIRDLAIAVIAEKKAGENLPFEPDYSLSQFYNVWGIISNSMWLNEHVRIILPFFEYEGITEMTNAPGAIIFEPIPGERSFHILGMAGVPANVNEIGIIHMNERFMIEDFRNDERLTLSTMVHELIHFQRGGFLGGPPDWLESSTYEANTQAATLEVLAAMCNYKNEVACKAFWDDIYAYARGSFRMRLRRWGLEDWYYPIADLLWWDDVERRAADKSLRYWMNDIDRKSYLYSTIYSYQQRPWEYVVLPGILGKPLDTGLEGKCDVTTVGIRCEPILMVFDDTIDLIGNFVLWLTRTLT